jgi:hypothetical protein
MKQGKIERILLSLINKFRKVETSQLIFIRVTEKFDVVEKPPYKGWILGPHNK